MISCTREQVADTVYVFRTYNDKEQIREDVITTNNIEEDFKLYKGLITLKRALEV